MVLKTAHLLQDQDFETFLQEEQEYIANLKNPRGNPFEFVYVEALEAFEDAE